MDPAFVVRLRPAGPWRIGADSGARDRLDRIYRSDTLFSAVSHAMVRLGMLEEWLAATAENPGGPAARFSSCFPFVDDVLFVPPPRSLWPPPLSAKVRWKTARFVPVSLARSLVADEPVNEDRWIVDGESQCLLPHDLRGRMGAVRASTRSCAAVDRLSGGLAVHRAACLEFAAGTGFWAVVTFADEAAAERWSGAIRAALRLLGDSGLGGRRSSGWGHCTVEFLDGTFPELLVGEPAPAPLEEGAGEAAAKPQGESAYWLLSTFAPAADDAVDWQRGSYVLVNRGGRVESPARSGEEKKTLRMVGEGSVLVAGSPPRGAAFDVAPDGFPHPVFRAGFAVAIPMPLRLAERSFTTL